MGLRDFHLLGVRLIKRLYRFRFSKNLPAHYIIGLQNRSRKTRCVPAGKRPGPGMIYSPVPGGACTRQTDMGGAKEQGETVPAERGETVRQEIRAFLEGPPATVREISGAVRASEKEVLGHLQHLEKSLSRQGSRLVVAPAECGKCGFVFRKRTRFKKPGRCPLCRGTVIHEPLFSVEHRR